MGTINCAIYKICDSGIYFFQRAFAAFKAIVFLRLADSFFALALPPLNPPKRPRDTAAGLLLSKCNSRGEPSRRSPIAFSTVRRATEIKSGCLSCFIFSTIPNHIEIAIGWDFKLARYRELTSMLD